MSWHHCKALDWYFAPCTGEWQGHATTTRDLHQLKCKPPWPLTAQGRASV